MVQILIDILLLRRLGLGRVLRYAILAALFGAVIAGLIYAFTVFSAVDEREEEHVHEYSRN
jgi:hypothetical protein